MHDARCMFFFILHPVSRILYPAFYRFMMVCNYYINTLSFCISSSLKRCYAAVNRDYECCPEFLCNLYSGRIEAIAMCNSVRDKIMDVQAMHSERMDHYCRGSEAVGVIITVDKDAFINIKRMLYSFHGSFYSGQFKRV